MTLTLNSINRVRTWASDLSQKKFNIENLAIELLQIIHLLNGCEVRWLNENQVRFSIDNKEIYVSSGISLGVFRMILSRIAFFFKIML